MKNQQLYKEVIRLIEAQNINLSILDHFLLKKVVQMTKKIIKSIERYLWGLIIILTIISVFEIYENSKLEEKNINLQNKLNRFYFENDSLVGELYKWNDHALRMKRICGINDTVQWSYTVKCQHPINTRNLTKYNIK